MVSRGGGGGRFVGGEAADVERKKGHKEEGYEEDKDCKGHKGVHS